jgi:hypothetical protein
MIICDNQRVDKFSAVLLLVPVIGALVLGSLYGPVVQVSLKPRNEIMTASNNVLHSDTFSVAGSIDSIDSTGNGTAIVTSTWSIDIKNGNVTAFSASLQAWTPPSCCQS